MVFWGLCDKLKGQSSNLRVILPRKEEHSLIICSKSGWFSHTSLFCLSLLGTDHKHSLINGESDLSSNTNVDTFLICFS